MSFRNTISIRRSRSWTAILLFACTMLLLGARPVHAGNLCIGNYGGVIDGKVTPVPPNLQTDGNCTIRNFPASNPYNGNVSTLSTSNSLLVFDNVDFTGNLSCDLSHNNLIWFANGSLTRSHILKCANQFAPVDTINKQNPAGQTTAAIGVPFTYTLTFPLLTSATTGGIVNSGGSNTDIGQITVTDDLNATGVSLSYVSSSASWKGSGAPVPISVTNAGGLLTFSGFPTIPAGQQIVLNITVVLNNAVPPNSPGTQFVNTATWTLGTTLNGNYQYPLPGQNGISPPMTIAAPPNLVMTKSGAATMNLGQWGQFGLNVQNTGGSDAWNVTLQDRLPSGTTGGMCNTTPQILSAQVFQSDGVTAVPGKGPLNPNTDFIVTYGPAPTCALTLTMLSAATVISPSQRLIVTYQAQLDANSQNGAQLTNVAGAVQWFNGPSSAASRQTYTNTLTNGTPGVLDFQDAHTVTVALSGVTITKQVSVVGGGPALPGAQLDYLVHVTNVGASPVNSVVVTDNLNAAGAGALTYVNPSATLNGSTTGVSVTGNVVTADYSSINGPLQPGQSADLHFQATIGAGVSTGTTITNTGVVTWNNPQQSASASASVQVAVPNLTLTKSGLTTMSVGQWGQFGLNVQNTGASDAWNVTLQDRLPYGATGGMCNTTPQILSAQVFQSDGVTAVPGKGALSPNTDFTVNYSATPTCALTLTMLSAAGVISPSQRLIVTYQTQLDANSQNGAQLTNVAGAVQWYSGPSSDTGRQTYNRTITNGTTGVLDFQDAHTVTVTLSAVTITKQVSVVGGGPALPGGQLDYVVQVTNVSSSPVNSVVITDNLTAAGSGVLTYVNQSAALNGATTGVSVTGNIITANYASLPPGQALNLHFLATIGTGVATGTTITNTGVVTWNSPQQNLSASASIQVEVPNLTLTKTGPAAMVAGRWGQFGLNVQNTGGSDAWNVTLQDRLPYGATGGMCNTTPQIAGAQVFQADGVTAVPGKGPLVNNTDFTVNYSAAPTCTLTLTMLSAAGAIGPSQRLIVTYLTQLDANSRSGAQLTNVAGAVQWYSGPTSDSGRQTYNRTITNGTPGTLDFQDAFTVTLAAVTITKQVSVVGGGPALPGAQLVYLVHVTNASSSPVNSVVIADDLNAAGPGALTYANQSATLNGSATGVSVTGNVITANYSSTNGPLQPGQSVDLYFLATIGTGVSTGTTITNTGVVTWNNPQQSASASASVQVEVPNLTLTKSGPATLNVGQWGQFGLNVQNTGGSDAWNVTLQDRLPYGSAGGMCNAAPQILSAQVFQADGVTAVPGKGPLSPNTDFMVNYSAAPTCTLTLTMLSASGTISPSQRLIVTYQTQLDANSQNGAQLTNVAGAVQWYSGPGSDTGRQTYNRTITDGTANVLDFQDAHTVTVTISAVKITKQVSVVGGGAALPGAQLDYLVHVTNVSSNPVNYVVITDNLNAAGPGALTYVNQSATLNAATTGVSVTGNVITADYSTTNGPLQPGQSLDLHFRATIGTAVPVGTTITNTGVVTWNNPPQTASASVSIDVGGIVGSGILNGIVWDDPNFNKVPDPGEPRLQGWSVALYRNGVPVQSVLTDANGVYRIVGVYPNYGTTDQYVLLFTAPGAGAMTAKLGKADSIFTNTLQQISNIIVQSGSNLQNMNLPIAPNGVVYNSAIRTPIAGATLTMLRAGSSAVLPSSCFDDPNQQNQVTPAAGWYRFDINFSDPACPSGGNYLLQVTPPGSAYLDGVSQVIPPASSGSNAPVSVPGCPGGPFDAVPGTTQYCEAQVSEFAPPPSVPAVGTGTRYFLNLTLDGSYIPGSNQIYNNHIPVDLIPAGALVITKTTPLLDVTLGQLVPYTITVSNVVAGILQGVSIVDRFPAGFRYVKGSARLDNVPSEPTVAGLQLTWGNISFASNQHHTIVLLLAVGAGVGEGEFVNRAQALSGVSGNPISGQATATVRVVPDTTFDCTDVFGKVFDDKNRNGIQDPGEKGIAGVRVVTTRGLAAVTDGYGRFHITCAITPREGRGSNFALKLDDRTLPSGFRPTTDQVLVERATRGKALKFNFGAAINHVVSLDLTDAVFEPGTTQMRPQWQPRIQLLLDELRKSPSVLHLSYLADVEESRLVEQRLNAVKGETTAAWDKMNCCYKLTIESEVFWLRGDPPKYPVERVGAGR
jgi:uncharacterized repeat protein (TIGR01451 family)/fimbrial isopeptide formation D2 family protein